VLTDAQATQLGLALPGIGEPSRYAAGGCMWNYPGTATWMSLTLADDNVYAPGGFGAGPEGYTPLRIFGFDAERYIERSGDDVACVVKVRLGGGANGGSVGAYGRSQAGLLGSINADELCTRTTAVVTQVIQRLR
jgi:hypothetical protein